MNAATFALAAQERLSAALEALSEEDRANALIHLAAVTDQSRRAAEAIHREARAHLAGEARQALCGPDVRLTDEEVTAYARRLRTR